MNTTQCQQHYRDMRDGASLAARVIMAIARDERDDLVAADSIFAIARTFREQFGRIVMTDGFTRGQRYGLVAIERKLDRLTSRVWSARFETGQ